MIGSVFTSDTNTEVRKFWGCLDIFDEVHAMIKSRIDRNPIFSTSWRVFILKSEGRNPSDRTSHVPPLNARIFSMPRSFAVLILFVTIEQTWTYMKLTRRASSTVPCIIFVQVKCMIVSSPQSFWANPARSRLRSIVLPPAPHVTETARGFNEDSREIRVSKFSNP